MDALEMPTPGRHPLCSLISQARRTRLCGETILTRFPLCGTQGEWRPPTENRNNIDRNIIKTVASYLSEADS